MGSFLNESNADRTIGSSEWEFQVTFTWILKMVYYVIALSLNLLTFALAPKKLLTKPSFKLYIQHMCVAHILFNLTHLFLLDIHWNGQHWTTNDVIACFYTTLVILFYYLLAFQVTLLSLDRWAAVYFRQNYHKITTAKVSLIAIGMMWGLAVAATSGTVTSDFRTYRLPILSSLTLLCVLTTILSTWKLVVYLRVRNVFPLLDETVVEASRTDLTIRERLFKSSLDVRENDILKFRSNGSDSGNGGEVMYGSKATGSLRLGSKGTSSNVLGLDVSTLSSSSAVISVRTADVQRQLASSATVTEKKDIPSQKPQSAKTSIKKVLPKQIMSSKSITESPRKLGDKDKKECESDCSSVSSSSSNYKPSPRHNTTVHKLSLDTTRQNKKVSTHYVSSKLKNTNSVGNDETSRATKILPTNRDSGSSSGSSISSSSNKVIPVKTTHGSDRIVPISVTCRCPQNTSTTLPLQSFQKAGPSREPSIERIDSPSSSSLKTPDNTMQVFSISAQRLDRRDKRENLQLQVPSDRPRTPFLSPPSSMSQRNSDASVGTLAPTRRIVYFATLLVGVWHCITALPLVVYFFILCLLHDSAVEVRPGDAGSRDAHLALVIGPYISAVVNPVVYCWRLIMKWELCAGCTN